MSRLRGARSVTSLVADPDHAVRDLFEPRDHPQEGRFAAAGRPDEHEELAVGDLQRDVVDGGDRAESLRHAVERDLRHAAMV